MVGRKVTVTELLRVVLSSFSGRVSLSFSGPPVELTAEGSGYLFRKSEFATRLRVPRRHGLGGAWVA